MLKCKICGKIVKMHLKKHILKHLKHEIATTECPICKIKFSSSKGLNLHLRLYRGRYEREREHRALSYLLTSARGRRGRGVEWSAFIETYYEEVK